MGQEEASKVWEHMKNWAAVLQRWFLARACIWHS